MYDRIVFVKRRSKVDYVKNESLTRYGIKAVVVKGTQIYGFFSGISLFRGTTFFTGRLGGFVFTLELTCGFFSFFRIYRY